MFYEDLIQSMIICLKISLSSLSLSRVYLPRYLSHLSCSLWSNSVQYLLLFQLPCLSPWHILNFSFLFPHISYCRESKQFKDDKNLISLYLLEYSLCLLISNYPGIFFPDSPVFCQLETRVQLYKSQRGAAREY